jgi:hypothetical protein
MIRAQQGHIDEARQWHKKARDWIAESNPTDQDLLGLAAEADGLIHSTHPESIKTITSTEQTQ